MSKSLFYQFNSALDMCFVLHFDKHSDKHNPHSESDHIIKSLSAKNCDRVKPKALHTASNVTMLGIVFLLYKFDTVPCANPASFAIR